MRKFFFEKRQRLSNADQSGAPVFAYGFTLLEVVVVLIILGILAALAVSRFGDNNAETVAEAEIFKSHLRYAQLRAMGDIVPWTIEVGSGSYALSKGKSGSTTSQNLPGESGASHLIDGGVTASSGTIAFNWRGQATTTPSEDKVVFTGKSGNTVTVNITPETGFAQ